MSDRLVDWRGVRVVPQMARRLVLLPDSIRPTGSRSGLRTWLDYVALRDSGRPASRTSWHFSGWACDVSPSSAVTPDLLRRADLGQPVSGEPWHLEPHTLGANPWRVWSSGRRVPGWRLAIADLGRDAWDGWVDPGASDVERAYPAVALAQAYCAFAATLSVDDVDGSYGPRSRRAFGHLWKGGSIVEQDACLAALRDAAVRRGVFSGEALRRDQP